MATIKIKSVRNGLPIFVLTTLFFLTTFFAKADVEYSTPLHGKEFKMGNRIEWKTAYEMDTKMFIVEKSDDGINFYMEREIQAAGISNKEKAMVFTSRSFPVFVKKKSIIFQQIKVIFNLAIFAV